MNKKKKYLIIPVIIAIIGAGYMGYSDSKGLSNNFGEILIGLGICLSIFNLLFIRKKESNKDS